MKNGYIHDIPDHDGLGIDNEGTIYILDKDREVISQISANVKQFIFMGRQYIPNELFNITFFGVKYPILYRDIYRIDEDRIIINDRIFKRISVLPDDVNKFYYISDSGIIYSLSSHKLRKQEVDEDGYHRISFSRNNLTHIGIHRLVFSIWKGNIPDGMVIDHINNRKWDNRVSNLQIITAEFNSRLAALNGLYYGSFKLDENKVHLCCQLMEKNVPLYEIAKSIGVNTEDKKEYKLFTNRMAAMRRPDYPAWKDIVSQYNISKYMGYATVKSKYSDLEILDMRKMYQDGIPIQEIADKYNPEDREYIRRLAKGEKRKNIAI